ncbi:hypothetical protein H0H93_004862, partial [Arthromyces matolae]
TTEYDDTTGTYIPRNRHSKLSSKARRLYYICGVIGVDVRGAWRVYGVVINRK